MALSAPPGVDRFCVYALPEGPGAALSVPPRLTSWERGEDRDAAPDQARLRAFLDHVDEVGATLLAGLGRPLALRLDISLPPQVSLLDGHDLDGYLQGPAERFAGEHVLWAWAAKGDGGSATLV